jgi:hypothetical protein
MRFNARRTLLREPCESRRQEFDEWQRLNATLLLGSDLCNPLTPKQNLLKKHLNIALTEKNGK